MSSNVQCTALNNAIRAKGYTHSQLADRVGSTPERVTDILSGQAKPTQQEFDSLARTLGVTNPVSSCARYPNLQTSS
ncbi:hypothetical protein F5148DRAFT_1166626 [Russula earlei]|uniref:Uncharacterized protein n=1 Tax=Russula earlei TaxID=71964 RepID=A0ACC0UL09_9AGAM|nr:hypothetical protein F5148DRAFT_1166626 [Russula earlei]